MGRHAYLIMAHKNPNQLVKLLECLDYEDNDIFILFDKKYQSLDTSLLEKCVKKSGLYFTPRISVNWGGYSQLQARYLLLKLASGKEAYEYYHFLSGQDLPLYSQQEIHSFFDKHKGAEFISIGPLSDWYLDRAQYYWFLQDTKWNRSETVKFLDKCWLKLQIIFGINRLKKVNTDLYIGEVWFSVTDKFVKYALSMESFSDSVFRYGSCVDELLFPTIYMMWQDKNKRYVSPKKSDVFDAQRMDILRAVDWNRGQPYTYRLEDYDMIMQSSCLFARKFDESIDNDIILKICDKVCSNTKHN